MERKIGINFILPYSWNYESKILTIPEVVIEDNHRQSISNMNSQNDMKISHETYEKVLQCKENIS